MVVFTPSSAWKLPRLSDVMFENQRCRGRGRREGKGRERKGGGDSEREV